jgi:hypothetical protein
MVSEGLPGRRGTFEEGLGQRVMVLHAPLHVARRRADGWLAKGGVPHA